MRKSLILNSKTYYYERIKSGRWREEALTPFENNTLLFCRDWLNGRASFEFFTSGSTGPPKAITVSRTQMTASARLTVQKFGLVSGDCLLVCIDTAFIGGKMMLVRGMEHDLSLTIVSPSADPLSDLGDTERFDFTALVPLQLKAILEKRPENAAILAGMKGIIVGGGPVSTSLQDTIQHIQAPIYSTYGMTETVSHVALRKLNDQDKRSYFSTLPEVVISKDGRGCLIVKGPMTNFKPVVTNDLVTLLSPTQFKWEGRIDNVINSGGVKINIEILENKIETILNDMGIKKRLIVAAKKDASLGEKAVLILEGAALSQQQEQTLTNVFRKTLPAYHHPKNIYYLNRFIETKSGKIQRLENAERISKENP